MIDKIILKITINRKREFFWFANDSLCNVIN